MNLFSDNHCFICNSILYKNEIAVCRHCNNTLPRTNIHLQKDNIAEQLFFGKEDIIKAASFCFYASGSSFQKAVHKFKYNNNPQLAYNLALIYSKEIISSGWFNDLEAIIPVPIHHLKQLLRGYNQSYWIAKGISKITNLPIINNSLTKTRNNLSQTSHSFFDRHSNSDNAYKLKKDNLPNNILLIDDVLTSGATLQACIKAIKEVRECNISILTLAIAH